MMGVFFAVMEIYILSIKMSWSYSRNWSPGHEDLSNKLESPTELPEVSWLKFIEESETSDALIEERVEDPEGEEECGLNPYSLK